MSPREMGADIVAGGRQRVVVAVESGKGVTEVGFLCSCSTMK